MTTPTDDVVIGEFIARYEEAAEGVSMDYETAELLARELKRLTAALADANARADRERAAVVAWMRDDADQTERCAINLAPKLVKSQYQEWVDLVATKRGIANAIERGQHLATKRATALSDLAALDGESL